MSLWFCALILPLLVAATVGGQEPPRTVALWLFDEQIGIYPSCVLGDAAWGNFPLVIGPGGQIIEGKFGHALATCQPPKISYPPEEYLIGLAEKQTAAINRPDAAPAITWANNKFCALMTRGERHLRQEVDFASPTQSDLNLGNTDWTIEFWLAHDDQTPKEDGVVFEIGKGPRGANDHVTSLLVTPDRAGFTLVNQPSGTRLEIPSAKPVAGQWSHYAFVYDAAGGQLRHYVDGHLQPLPAKCRLASLSTGDEDYMSLGRDARWNRPLGGALDELRVSRGQVYDREFQPPASFSKYQHGYQPPKLLAGPPLLFGAQANKKDIVDLGNRKHLFLDDALLAQSNGIAFQANPPRLAELVLENVGFSNHVTVFEDEESGDGLVRLYFRGPKDCLQVWVSNDGVHFHAPDLGTQYEGLKNVVITDPVGLGTLFIDPNAPKEERIKYFSGYRGRGQYVYSSPDGYHFTRNETSSLPFRGASQSLVFYDDQRQVYVGYHRTDMYRTPFGKTERGAVMTETKDLMRPWPFRPVSQDEQSALEEKLRIGRKNPYYVDNGPVTPPGFGVEYPRVFAPIEGLDSPGVDIYVPKCEKYQWAPDGYVAFPLMYFHYEGDGPETRHVLGEENRGRGSGPLETQLAVSRDGIHWKRYPRPTYLGIGRHAGLDLKRTYIAHKMVRRGDELWQYYVGCETYHSPFQKEGREAILRTVQRLDGFVSADFDYTGGEFTTRPLRFTGNRLMLNVDTDATGFLQIGLLDESGKSLDGFKVDDCIYVNDDSTHAEAEWMKRGKDLSSVAGKAVRLVFRGRGAKLFSLQFVEAK
jgi:hypothetical protein